MRIHIHHVQRLGQKMLPGAMAALGSVGTALLCNIGSTLGPKLFEYIADKIEDPYKRAYRLERKRLLKEEAKKQALQDHDKTSRS